LCICRCRWVVGGGGGWIGDKKGRGRGEGLLLHEKPALHVTTTAWETKMDAVRAGGNCLIIHLVASMDMHYVRPALRKTKEQHVYIRGCAYPTHTNYTRIGLHVGFHQVTGHFKMSINFCDIITVPFLPFVFTLSILCCGWPSTYR